MNYYIIAGEASGDLHAANLMKEINQLDSSAKFRCWGGDKMEKQGAELVKHYRDLAFMGFIEVLLNIRIILKNISFCKKDILRNKPDALILVDYPGFNLRIAKFAKQHQIKVFYYISPQIWAWKKSRVHTIKKVVDRMFVILPFEKDFYKKYNYNVDFVGHPLLDEISETVTDKYEILLDKHSLSGKPLITLLPGSRKQEISKILKTMIEVIPIYPNHQFVIAAAPSIPEEFYKKYIGNLEIEIIYDHTYDLLKHSKAAIVTSGTATLETALFNIPEVVCYKGSFLSVQIAKRIIKIKFISLVNLIMDDEIVKELIQEDFNLDNLKNEMDKILFDISYREKMHENFRLLKEKLGGAEASKNTAKFIFEHLKNNVKN